MAFYCSYGFYDREFVQSDLNHDGSLDRNTDYNHNGFIDFREFAMGAAPHLNVPFGSARQAFNIADHDHNGVLDRRELAEFSKY